MLPDIFDIEKGELVVNVTCLSIPELKAVVEEYEDPIPALSFLCHMYTPKGAYCNVPEEDREDILLEDFPGDYTLEDPVMIDAMRKLEELTLTPTYRYYLDSKYLLEKLGKYGRETSITSGKDGNISAFNMQIKSTGKTILEFKQLEKLAKEELEEGRSRVRGDKRKAYDQ